MGRARYGPTFLVAASISFVVGCGLRGPSQFVHEADYTETIRVACVGNSITYGSKIPIRSRNSYPAQLGRLLGERWEVRNFGVSGATLLKRGDRPYWKEPAFHLAQEYRPHVVILMLGTNDTKPQNWRHARAFVDDYVEMIRIFAGLESRPLIWICYPVPAYPGRSGIRNSIINPEVLAKIDRISAKTGSPIIDLYDALSNEARLFPDKIHPNAAGARKIAETVYTALTGRTAAAPRIRAIALSPHPARADLRSDPWRERGGPSPLHARAVCHSRLGEGAPEGVRVAGIRRPLCDHGRVRSALGTPRTPRRAHRIRRHQPAVLGAVARTLVGL